MCRSDPNVILSCRGYNKETAKQKYMDWMDSNPFGIGETTASGLSGRLNSKSQANGAMMRISPLAVYLSKFGYAENEDWQIADTRAASDALITHPNPICIHANILFVRTLITLISSETDPAELYQKIKEWSNEIGADRSLLTVIESAEKDPPSNYTENQGWVLIAFWNAIYQLLHAGSPLEGILNTVKSGGDTDTNAAIAGALLGARFGYDAFPKQWLDTVQACKPGGERPRPDIYWVGDIKNLTENIFNCYLFIYVR
ncbi:MAG: ADP-ribosylglycohydrolase family protein [Synergistaceae bacterium]|nr:ADP-ribosylglycohydrolase family protein [Synergistaceae bacterium]